MDKVPTDNILVLAKAYGLTETGLSILQNVITSEPARRVSANSTAGNRAIRYPSKKMGVVIQAESKSLEFASILEKEFSDDVLYFYDQPPPLELVYTSGQRTVRTSSTLDYFVISKSFIGFEEWKPFSQLTEISKKRPDYIAYNPKENFFTSPAIERALSGTGLSYRILSEKDINSTLIENLDFLNGYLNVRQYDIDPKNWKKLSSLLKTHKSLTINEVLSQGISPDALYYSIIKKTIFFPLKELRIQSTDSPAIFDDIDTWKKIKAVQNTEKSNDTPLESLPDSLLYADTNDIEIAAKRLTLIEEVSTGKISIEECAERLNASSRSIYRWKKLISQTDSRAEKLNQLIAKKHKQGNKRNKISGKILDQIDTIINEHHLTKRAISPHKACLKVIAWCNENSIHPPSKTTVYRYINSLSDKIVALKRQGSKAAYQHTANQLTQANDLPLASAYFLHRCHIDHTQLDIELIDEFGEPLGKPWITVIIDEYTGFALSYYISFRNPSYISIMMALRLMVKEHNLLPESLVVDGGKEFKSVSFETLCGIYNISIFSREGQPRAGGAIERFFGILNTQLIHNLDGNTKFMKNIRSVSQSHNPKRSASWTIESLSRAILEYLKIHNRKSSKKGSLSPQKLAERSKTIHGERSYLQYNYDNNFYVHTLPNIPRKTVTLKKGKNVVYDYHEYWHSSFHHAPKDGIKVQAKWDPLDSEVLYVFHTKSWIRCRLSSRRNKTNVSDKALSAELTRQEARINNLSKSQSYIEISKSVDNLEKDLKPKEKQKSRKIENTPKPDKEETFGFSLLDLEIPESLEK